MPRGDKSSYTEKQKRQARHIEEGYETRGVDREEAERRAWATVNQETHGGKKSGSGRGRKVDISASRKGGDWEARPRPRARRQRVRHPRKKRPPRESGGVTEAAMIQKSLHDYPAEKARQGEIILRKPWQRYVFFGGLAGCVLLTFGGWIWVVFYH